VSTIGSLPPKFAQMHALRALTGISVIEDLADGREGSAQAPPSCTNPAVPPLPGLSKTGEVPLTTTR
jgi:hypothetical protein